MGGNGELYEKYAKNYIINIAYYLYNFVRDMRSQCN